MHSVSVLETFDNRALRSPTPLLVRFQVRQYINRVQLSALPPTIFRKKTYGICYKISQWCLNSLCMILNIIGILRNTLSHPIRILDVSAHSRKFRSKCMLHWGGSLNCGIWRPVDTSFSNMDLQEKNNNY